MAQPRILQAALRWLLRKAAVTTAPGKAGLGVETARLGKPESLTRGLYHGCAIWQGVALGAGAAEDL